jgi:glutamate-1-semialdehyde 2,1-aminomutase
MNRSEQAFEIAQRYIPGGVNSPVRAFKSVGGTPRFIDRAEGPYIFDIDGQRYIDYVLSWGPMVLGHAQPEVIAAITAQATRGTSYGAPTELETELAQLVCEQVPSVEMVRFVNSGTEATMSALRLARAYTGRAKILKFAGGYHGHADFLLTNAGSGVATLGLPASAGVTTGQTADTITVEFNDLAAAAEAFAQLGEQIAAVIVEPVAGNMGLIQPQPGFLQGLRDLTEQHGALLIFDEVMTGFRVARGGAQERFGITPDLTCLGKVVGGGLPCAAYGGRRVIMEHVAPLGAMYQAGTLSGNPLAMAAGIATLRQLTPALYEQMEQAGTRLVTGLRDLAASSDIPLEVGAIGSMISFFFASEPVQSYADAKRVCDTQRYAFFFHAMLERGVYFAPSQFEAGFLSVLHDAALIDQTLEAAQAVLPTMR